MSQEHDQHAPCAVEILDTETGVAYVCADWSAWYWGDGNGSCDCNRDIKHGLYAVEDADDFTCHGCERYLVIGCSAPGYTFREMNSGYPDALLEEHEGRWRTLPPGAYVAHGHATPSEAP